MKFSIGNCSSLLVYDTFEAYVTENVKVVFTKENSNLALIPRRLTSVLSHGVPWVIEELDAVDSGRYPWFYSGWTPKESIGRTDRFVAGELSDISEAMIKSSFFECLQIMMFLCYFFVTTSSVFCLLFFFFPKEQSKIGVHIIIIHRHALYTGKYGTYS